MANNYGLVYTADQAKQQLLNMNRDYNNRLTWQNLFNQNNITAQRAENQLVNQYTDASVDAYASYLQNQNAIKNSQIVGQGKQQLLNENELALQDAYNAYKQQFSEGQQSIASAQAEGEAAITEALEEQAQMTADYTNAHYSYLEALYDKYLSGENGYFAEGQQWNKYVTYDELLDENGNVIYDENGVALLDETSPRLMTWSEITNPKNGFYNEDGTLTIKGVDFFDQIENQVAYMGDDYTWGQYLSETNPELLDWANSYNPYNYTQAGTNAGTMRTMYGLMSTDNDYSFAERFGGLSEDEITEMYSGFQSAAEELGNAIASSGKDQGKSQIQSIQNYVNEIQTMTTNLGIEQDIENELGMTFEELTTALDTYVNQARSQGEMTGDWFANLIPAAGAGAITAASSIAASSAATTAMGSTLLGATASNPVGWIIAGVLAIGGIANASINTDNQRNLNKQLAERSKQLYDNLLNTMVNYSLNKRRQAEIDFNTANIY